MKATPSSTKHRMCGSHPVQGACPPQPVRHGRMAWQTIRDHLQPAGVHVVHGNRSRSRTVTFVVTRAPVSRQTRGCSAFQCVPSTAERPCLCASCTVVANDIQETATPSEVPKEQHSKQGGNDSRQRRRRESRGRDTRQRASLQGEQRLLKQREPGSDAAFHQVTVD